MRELARETTTKSFDDLSDPNVYTAHSKFFIQCANDLLREQGKKFVVDDNNRDVLKFLLYYFNNCDLALQVFPDKTKYKLENNILLCGTKGVGKTFIMDAFALYLKRLRNPNAFLNISVTRLINDYKVSGEINKYTYNISDQKGFEGNPFHICLNDVGIAAQKHYGNDTNLIVDEFLFARNEIWSLDGIKAHLTTNLDVQDIKQLFDDEHGRLLDRFKTYNVIHIKGESRR